VDEGALIDRLTEVFKRTGRVVGVVVDATLSDADGARLRDREVTLDEARRDELAAAREEFVATTRPTADALDAVMREQGKLLEERRRAAEGDAAERRKGIYGEYKDAVAPAASARDVALKQAQARLYRKTAKINAEFAGHVARARALAVLGVGDEGGRE